MEIPGPRTDQDMDPQRRILFFDSPEQFQGRGQAILFQRGTELDPFRPAPDRRRNARRKDKSS